MGREGKKEENIQCETNMNEQYINPCPFLMVEKGSIYSFIYSTIIIKNQGWRYCLNVMGQPGWGEEFGEEWIPVMYG